MEASPLTRYLLFQLYAAKMAIPHITKKSNPENLHKFRVAIRRIRSLLSLYLPDFYALSDILKSIVRQTNEIRELDVFINELDATQYPRVYSKLQRYREGMFNGQLSKKSLFNMAVKIDRLYYDLLNIRTDLRNDDLCLNATKHYMHCIKLYSSLKGDEPEGVLHKLRIEFKIARYAFDFLTKSAIKNERSRSLECEDIQEHLGALQDAANQIEWLTKFCEAYPSGECKHLLKCKKEKLRELKKATASNRQE